MYNGLEDLLREASEGATVLDLDGISWIFSDRAAALTLDVLARSTRKAIETDNDVNNIEHLYFPLELVCSGMWGTYAVSQMDTLAAINRLHDDLFFTVTREGKTQKIHMADLTIDFKKSASGDAVPLVKISNFVNLLDVHAMLEADGLYYDRNKGE